MTQKDRVRSMIESVMSGVDPDRVVSEAGDPGIAFMHKHIQNMARKGLRSSSHPAFLAGLKLAKEDATAEGGYKSGLTHFYTPRSSSSVHKKAEDHAYQKFGQPTGKYDYQRARSVSRHIRLFRKGYEYGQAHNWEE